ncbi:RNA polymerase sigma factor [Chitinophaga sp. sic0106]|uniref:RNA polymerase sigma factor n=1 Tax=Chitinophaga sp. sic0106 TaxID=2854785 RepID=UPI001C47B2A7|nr:RNA polymerase sigma factor [Chitinophaga sp. sic0106]MBV7533262.1 RNA polymerase sigma factor [Chitinophaga sp. sic0106]
MRKITDSSHQLLLQVAAGETNAFGALMEQYHAIPYNTARRLLGEHWLAEDIVQEIFLKIWINREQLPAISNFRAWLITITTNKVYDHLRNQKLHTQHQEEWREQLHLQMPPEEENRLNELLGQAVTRLSPKQRTAFTYIKLQGFSRQETAIIMKVSPETVKTHLEAAMRTVRAYCLSQLDAGTSILLLAVLLKIIL